MIFYILFQSHFSSIYILPCIALVYSISIRKMILEHSMVTHEHFVNVICVKNY